MTRLDVTFRKWGHTKKDVLDKFYSLLVDDRFSEEDLLGPYEPLEYRFSDFTPDSFAELVLEERSLMAESEPSARQSLFLRNLISPKKPNRFIHYFEGVGTSDQVDICLEYGKSIFRLFKPDYGNVRSYPEYFSKNLVEGPIVANAVGINLRKHLPGIYWANFFGPRYVEFFGEGRLMSAPAHDVQRLGEAGILLLMSKSPFDYDKAEVKETEEAVVEHLGPEAFFFKSDPEEKKYRAPDLSDLPQFAPEANGQA
jgi:hypothetical protein